MDTQGAADVQGAQQSQQRAGNDGQVDQLRHHYQHQCENCLDHHRHTDADGQSRLDVDGSIKHLELIQKTSPDEAISKAIDQLIQHLQTSSPVELAKVTAMKDILNSLFNQSLNHTAAQAAGSQFEKSYKSGENPFAPRVPQTSDTAATQSDAQEHRYESPRQPVKKQKKDWRAKLQSFLK